jgi:hypothetical protein
MVPARDQDQDIDREGEVRRARAISFGGSSKAAGTTIRTEQKDRERFLEVSGAGTR